MRYWFAPPRAPNDYEGFAARTLHFTLLVLAGLTLVGVGLARSREQLLLILPLLAVLSGCYLLLHSGRVRLATQIFLLGLWLIVTVASYGLNGLRNASLSAYAIVIIFAALLLRPRAALIYTGLSVAAITLLYLGQSMSVLPLRLTPLYLTDRYVQLLALYLSAGVLLTAASRVISANLARLRAHEAALLDRNRALEVEIAERQRTEAELRLSEARYRLLFENIPIMAGVYDQDGQIALLNKAAAQILGGTPESLRGRNLRDVFTLGDAESAIATQARALREGKDILSEGQTVLPSGQPVHFLRHIMPLPAQDGTSSSQVLVLTTDLTEKIQAEAHARELALAQERSAFLDDFFTTLSHDLKTPLAIINTSLYLLERAETPDARAARIARIHEQVALVNRYIADMLVFSRLDRLAAPEFHPLDFNALIEEVINLLRPRIEARRIALVWTAQPDLPAVQGDRDQLVRLLINLIENAINYTPEAGSVSVTATRHADADNVIFEVADTGIGIEPEALPRIFERFYRTDRAKAASGSGTGLGLAIVRKIVEAHGGAITVDSTPGVGTRFSVLLATAPALAEAVGD